MSYKLRHIILLLSILFSVITEAQIRGVITDAATGDSIPYATVSYRGHNMNVVADEKGQFTVLRRNGWTLSFSSVGYKTQHLKVTTSTSSTLNITLQAEDKTLDEVTVNASKSKYSRKNNPAVELMKRVIAAKQQTKLENKDYYQFRTYEKITLSINDISDQTLDKSLFTKNQWLLDHIEVNPFTGKNTMPVMVSEKIFRKFYRQTPEKERIIVDAERSSGINELVETGGILTAAVSDVFSEIDIYDDQVRLLQYPFTSPIGKDAIAFYRFYICDTVAVGRDSCIHLSFVPNNQRDFGFRGDLWVLNDSTLHVRKVRLGIPKRSDVNFVDNMAIDQEYLHLPTGEWVLNTNDMTVEMSLVAGKGNFLINRHSRRNDYSFLPIPDKTFRGKAKEKYDPYAEMRTEDYWTDNRELPLTTAEQDMDNFLASMRNKKGFGWLMLAAKVLIENYLETTKSPNPSKIDIGPVNSMISTNAIDGLRLRVSAQTTAHLMQHLFLKGYIAHGFKTSNTYYSTTLTYSFPRRAYTPEEYPYHYISLSSAYDICSASDKFLDTDKDNVFTSLKWSSVQHMAYYKRQNLTYGLERDWGFALKAGINLEENTPTGALHYQKIYPSAADENPYQPIRLTEAWVELLYSPGQSYVNTKQRRRTVNHDAPIFRLKHTTGLRNIFGGQYSHNATEASIYKRIWLNSWGKLDVTLRLAAQWNTVPFPLLLTPPANLSYINTPATFSLIRNLEFLTDRQATLHLEWDLNGKLLNRIPLLQSLHMRELIGVNVLVGKLTDRNNPLLFENQQSNLLMHLPDETSLLSPRQPYVEVRIGLHNILNLFQIEYVRRLSYLNIPTATKRGVRFGLRITF